MKTYLQVTIAIIALCFLGCEVPNAEKSASKRLVIVSDYLHSKDTILFKGFSKVTNIRVRIVHKQADDIMGKLRNEPYNSGYDIIILNSLYDVNRFSKSTLLHPLEDLPNLPIEDYIHSSSKYNYIGFGLDPYTISYNPDSTFKHRTYSDLKNHDFVSTMDDRLMIPMLASLMSKLNKVKVYNWLKEFNSHRKTKLNDTKSINAFLTVHSQLESEKGKNEKLESLTVEHFPNAARDGVFYNLKTFCIVSHAENIFEAQSFIRYYLLPKNNGKLCERLNVFPASEIHNDVRFYKLKSEKLIQYYSMTERILNRTRK